MYVAKFFCKRERIVPDYTLDIFFFFFFFFGGGKGGGGGVGRVYSNLLSMDFSPKWTSLGTYTYCFL